jgi:ribosomal protein L37AE/L43A
MKILECPRCQRISLVPTGAFWACGSCGYTITQTALCVEQAGGQGKSRQPVGRRAREQVVP